MMSTASHTNNLLVAVLTKCNSGNNFFVPKFDNFGQNIQLLVGSDVEELQDKVTCIGSNLKNVDVIVFVPSVKISVLSELSLLCTSVRWVHVFSAGVDAFDSFVKNVILKRVEPPIHFTNAKGAFSESLSEFALMAALYFTKQMPRVIANKGIKKWDKFVMPMLNKKTIGIVGFGDIGRQCASIFRRAFGHIKIVALRRDISKGGKFEGGEADLIVSSSADDKLKIFSQSDVIICCLPATPYTKDFCSSEEFSAMKKTSIFISIGRGHCVDENALFSALESDCIMGAALDVFKTEPLGKTSKLWEAKNLIMTSHNADFTKDYCENGWEVFRNNMKSFLSGERMPTEVDTKLMY